MVDDIGIRPIMAVDEPFLRRMLYQAIYVPPEQQRPPEDIIEHPSLAKYIRCWGRSNDVGYLAIDRRKGRPVGAAWLRQFSAGDPGYAYIDDRTPELSMAVLPEYRGRSIGTQLLRRLIELARGRFPALSLSVAPQNPARRLYERFGFMAISASDSAVLMRLELHHEPPAG